MAEAGEAGATDEPRAIQDADVELAARLRLATARLYRRLRQHSLGGLTPSQLSCLTSVEKLEPVRLGDLAAREAVAPPTLTRIVAGLVELGMIERRADPDDARAALLTTTPKGRESLQTVREERTAFLVERLHHLPEIDREKLPGLVDLLERLPDA
jgi:DNA-binding MarR family transcriptional regulator